MADDRCPKCNALNSPGVRACAYCGHAFATSEPSQNVSGGTHAESDPLLLYAVRPFLYFDAMWLALIPGVIGVAFFGGMLCSTFLLIGSAILDGILHPHHLVRPNRIANMGFPAAAVASVLIGPIVFVWIRKKFGLDPEYRFYRGRIEIIGGGNNPSQRTVWHAWMREVVLVSNPLQSVLGLGTIRITLVDDSGGAAILSNVPGAKRIHQDLQEALKTFRSSHPFERAGRKEDPPESAGGAEGLPAQQTTQEDGGPQY